MGKKNDWMADCIHLKACRRARKKAKLLGIRGGYLVLDCNDTCSAYVSGNERSFVSVDEAICTARSAFDSIRRGYGNDSLVSSDFLSQTLGEIVNELQDE